MTVKKKIKKIKQKRTAFILFMTPSLILCVTKEAAPSLEAIYD